MPLPDPPLSRRALVQAAGIAPVILLARKAWAQPTDENMSALALATANVPADQLATIVQKAVDEHGVDPQKFELVARAMWAHFYLGVARVEVPETEKIVEYAYEFKSGPIVATRVNDDFFDPLGNHYITNFCCYVCGHHAARIALHGIEDPLCGDGGKLEAPVPTRVTRAIYECAWRITEREMKQKLAAARSMPQGSTLQDPFLGGGC